MGRVVNDVVHQAEELIDKIVPGSWIVLQAPLEEIAISSR
jgi:hypothetical protein